MLTCLVEARVDISITNVWIHDPSMGDGWYLPPEGIILEARRWRLTRKELGNEIAQRFSPITP